MRNLFYADNFFLRTNWNDWTRTKEAELAKPGHEEHSCKPEPKPKIKADYQLEYSETWTKNRELMIICVCDGTAKEFKQYQSGLIYVRGQWDGHPGEDIVPKERPRRGKICLLFWKGASMIFFFLLRRLIGTVGQLWKVSNQRWVFSFTHECHYSLKESRLLTILAQR